MSTFVRNVLVIIGLIAAGIAFGSYVERAGILWAKGPQVEYLPGQPAPGAVFDFTRPMFEVRYEQIDTTVTIVQCIDVPPDLQPEEPKEGATDLSDDIRFDLVPMGRGLTIGRQTATLRRFDPRERRWVFQEFDLRPRFRFFREVGANYRQFVSAETHVEFYGAVGIQHLGFEILTGPVVGTEGVGGFINLRYRF